jgi:hypothetical protein
VEEVDLVATSDARTFAVGKDVSKYLAQRGFPKPFTYVIHYSGRPRSLAVQVSAGTRPALSSSGAQFRLSACS